MMRVAVLVVALLCAGCLHLSHDDKVVLVSAAVDGAVCGATGALFAALGTGSATDAGPPSALPVYIDGGLYAFWCAGDYAPQMVEDGGAICVRFAGDGGG
jgi:hypothetical protein